MTAARYMVTGQLTVTPQGHTTFSLPFPINIPGSDYSMPDYEGSVWFHGDDVTVSTSVQGTTIATLVCGTHGHSVRELRELLGEDVMRARKRLLGHGGGALETFIDLAQLSRIEEILTQEPGIEPYDQDSTALYEVREELHLVA